MAGEQKSRYFHLTNSLKMVGRFLGRGNRRSIAQAVLQNPNLCHHVIDEVAKGIRKEIKKLCSKKQDSILRMKTKPALENLLWGRILDELQMHTPTLLAILKNCLPKSKSTSSTVSPAICMSASILLKPTNPHVNLAQGVLSVTLRASHATKQVCCIKY